MSTLIICICGEIRKFLCGYSLLSIAMVIDFNPSLAEYVLANSVDPDLHLLTGDQEVAGSTSAEVGNILSWRLIMKYFLRSFSPFC